jgi:hypothetical protein
MLWQTNRIRPLQFPRHQLQLHRRVAKAARVVEGMVARVADTVDTAAVAADVAKVVPAAVVADAVKAVPVVQAAVPAALAAASANFSVKRKFASSVSKRWI